MTLQEAADALAAADWVIVAAGAGFSADSGLPTYEECRALGIEYDNLARAELLYEDPSLFYGFWAGCAQKYRTVKPHEGYAILDRLLRPFADKGRVYIYTSNVDGHFRSLRGFPICEIHGCCEEWMCSAKVPYAAAELMHDLPPGCSRGDDVALDGARFKRVQESQRKLLQRSGRTACTKPCLTPAPATWVMDIDSLTMRANLVDSWVDELPANMESLAGTDDAFNWSHAPPLCGQCGLPLRPCVLMFADEDAALLRLLQTPARDYQRWEDAMEAEIESAGSGRVVILEIGVGRQASR